MYLHDKLTNARAIICTVALVFVAVVVVWKLIIR